MSSWTRGECFLKWPEPSVHPAQAGQVPGIVLLLPSAHGSCGGRIASYLMPSCGPAWYADGARNSSDCWLVLMLELLVTTGFPFPLVKTQG